jgi:hypothetical protein
MRRAPADASDAADLERLNAQPWMVDALKANPSYLGWGVHEDYMAKDGDGWDSRVLVPSWSALEFQLDELNECVNFYFHINRKSEQCGACGGAGYNPATKQIADDFYDFDRTGRRWVDKITQDEADALVAARRCGIWVGNEWTHPPRTAESINAENQPRAGMGHDAINRGILIETRAKRLGVWGLCPSCEGHGYVFTEPAAKLFLTLWMLHPRKGCSRGVEIQDVREEDLPAARAWLLKAAERNAARFAGLAP